MSKGKIALTSELSVPDGSHILYFYNTFDSYLDNLLSFIHTGIRLEQHIVVIDTAEHTAQLKDRMQQTLPGELLNCVHFVDNHVFYGVYGDFHFERILSNLAGLVQPFVEQEQTVRLWGHVDWSDQDNILSKLHTYECEADITISELGFVTVCAYNGLSVPAYIQTEMMKSHEYFMTDHELVLSNLYRSSAVTPTVFPSISIQDRMESEVDLYKQKLDFVHVVSHEVRNPLTIIKAYSSMLLQEETEPDRARKLQSICDYAVVIDNEISHIISTEQMLSSESLWKKKIILPAALLQEVLDIMEVKARAQNVRLEYDLALSGAETLTSNAMGFKLIVSNILNNAIKYSHENATVSFTCRQDGQHLLMETRDEGIGMSAEQLQRLFRKYEKMNDATTGQGIGLYMVKKLVDHFDGDVTVHSTEGQGSTFCVRLPLMA